MQVWPGSAYPLGATYDGMGTNFSLFSEVADAVELCLFDDAGHETKIRLPEVDGFVWHGYLPGVGPGQRYGYRVHGPYDRGAGLRCNPTKLLLDPYAKAIDGKVDWHPSLFSLRLRLPGRPQRRRLGAVPAEGRGGQPVLRLGHRPAAGPAVQRDGHLRGPRQGPDVPATRTSRWRCAAPTPGCPTRR